MKDMDNIAKPFHCNDPLTFNYLKYLTNTGDVGSQEAGIFSYANWISTHVEFLGKILKIPDFSDYLVDRLMVYLGDFMRGDVVKEYLEEQYEILNTEVTQSFLMFNTGGTGTFRNIVKSYCDFFYARPKEVYQHVADFYHLGYVIPMTTKGFGLPVSINDIPLTEGDFSGACFSDYSIRLNSGDEHTGWIMHIKYNDNTNYSYSFDSPDISIIPKQLQTYYVGDISCIEFETCPIEQISTSLYTKKTHNSCDEIDAVYSINGHMTSHYNFMPRIIHYTNGKSIKVSNREEYSKKVLKTIQH